MKRDGKPHKGGFVHRGLVARNQQSYSLGNGLAACGVKKDDGYSVHPARKLTTCPDCKRLTQESMDAQAGRDGRIPKRIPTVLGSNSGAAS
jgi:hypothetical protein